MDHHINEYNLYDDHEDQCCSDYDPPLYRRRTKRWIQPVCKFCGATGLHWVAPQGNVGWRLYTDTGELHNCEQYHLANGRNLIQERTTMMKWEESVCSNCGGTIHGDGITDVMHCENADWDDYYDRAPDSDVVLCRFDIEALSDDEDES